MFKNLSNRVSAKTIEETYTENDVEHVKDEHGKETTDISLNYIPNTGFTFDYPQRWLNEETDFKAIGIRRLKVVPTSHVFALNFVINYTKKSTNEDCGLSLTVRETVIAENSLEEIICDIINKLNSMLSTTNYSTNPLTKWNELAYFTYTFDYKTGDFSLILEWDDKNSYVTVNGFYIEGLGELGGNKVRNLDFFLKFLNQERNDDNKDKLAETNFNKHFTNVWDRSSLQFHASFSNNRRNFIGLNNDFYDSPSVFYDPPTNKSDFWIKFTTDGKHQFIPRYCRFYIGLSFVRNYKNSLVTK